MNYFWGSYLRMNVLKTKGINKKEKDVGSTQELSILRLPLAVSESTLGKKAEGSRRDASGAKDIITSVL